MALEKFHYKLPIGKDDEGDTEYFKVTLPKMDNIAFGVVRKNRRLPQHEQIFALLEEVCDEADLKQMDKATQADMSKMIEAWEEDTDMKPGESKGSSN